MSGAQRATYRLLAAHQLQYGPALGQICSCGHAPTPLRDPDSLLTQQDIHRGHVAAALVEAGFGDVAAAKAEALQEFQETVESLAGEMSAGAYLTLWTLARADRIGGDSDA